MTTLNDLRQRILSLSFTNGLTHIGSCLDALPIIYDIYKVRKKDEPFILSQGHAGLALYVILEAFYSIKNGFYGIDAQYLLSKHGTHPNTDLKNGIWASTGSLGHGIGIAVGMAIADRSKNVYCLISDGECAEGSIWESLEVAYKQKLTNLKLYLNANGYSAYDKVEVDRLISKLKAFGFPIKVYRSKKINLPFLSGLKAHYAKMSEKDYQEALEYLK